MMQQQQQGNKNQLHGNVNQLGMGPLLGNKSPNLQSPPNTLGMNSMPMSIANNGTPPMSTMQVMRGGAGQGAGVGAGGGMIMTNSNMGSMGGGVGMGGGGLVVNSLKSGGGMMMNPPNAMQPNNQQGIHHPMHQNSMQNGPMGAAGIRMNMQQQHIANMQRMPNQHMMNNQRMVLNQSQQVLNISFK